jgi:hypothetical protein
MNSTQVSFQLTTANFLSIQNDPTAASISPTSAYAGSTITVTGTNFIPGFLCDANVGAHPSVGTLATSCTLVSATTAAVVIASNTPSGAYPGVPSSVQLNFTNGAKVATVSLQPLSIVANPTAASISPTSAYAGSTITVTGTNFIPGFQLVTALV